MNLICFVCKRNIGSSIDLLRRHLRREHYLTSNSTLVCFVDNCVQRFTDFSSYKRHIMRIHASFKNHGDVSDNLLKIQEQNIDIDMVDLSEAVNPTKKPENVNLNEAVDRIRKDSQNFDFKKGVEELLEHSLKFSLLLHANNNFSRKDVYEVQESVQLNLIDPLLNLFKNFAQNKLNDEPNAQNQSEMFSMIFSCRNPFQYCRSDYMLSQKLKIMGYMDDIKEFKITSDVQPIFHHSELVYENKIIKGSILPLQSQFRLIFEHENLLLETLTFMENIYADTNYTNFIQGPLWEKKRQMYPGKTVIPYFLYADDLELNNPLGSHATTHSVCNFYYSFPCFPKYNSKLSNIFLAAIIKSKDLKNYGNEECLAALIEELKLLEVEGVQIKLLNGENRHVHFIMALFLGDNLGVNSLLNFSKSFSNGLFCRFCKVDRHACNKLCKESQEMMRTTENYKHDVVLQDSKTTGIINESSFNVIPSFHVVENFCVDVMHDILEGICHYDLCHILLYISQQMGYVTLDVINERKQTFDYGQNEIGNFSKEISITHLKNNHLKMSAREMLTFTMYLPLMIGDFIPVEDEVWQFLLTLIDIIDMVLSFQVTDNLISAMTQKIEVHNEQYMKLFQDTLKPKFHVLTHYPTILKMSGPLRHFWCFKFEAKHKQFKLYSHAITSRKNICLTLAKKYQLQFANQILHSTYNLNNYYEFDNKHKVDYKFSEIVRSKLELNEKEEMEFYDQVEYIGVTYKEGFYVAKCSNDYKIYLIKIVAKLNENCFLFCQQLKNVNFHSHFSAFEVDPLVVGEYFLISFKEIIGPPITLTKTAKGKNLIRIKEFFVQY